MLWGDGCLRHRTGSVAGGMVGLSSFGKRLRKDAVRKKGRNYMAIKDERQTGTGSGDGLKG